MTTPLQRKEKNLEQPELQIYVCEELLGELQKQEIDLLNCNIKFLPAHSL